MLSRKEKIEWLVENEPIPVDDVGNMIVSKTFWCEDRTKEYGYLTDDELDERYREQRGNFNLTAVQKKVLNSLSSTWLSEGESLLYLNGNYYKIGGLEMSESRTVVGKIIREISYDYLKIQILGKDE